MVSQLRELDHQHIELYSRIQAFSLDQPDAQLSFSGRLARDNDWSIDYARRVIEEYKKFAFLAVVAGHPVTPSDQVDQVWHLHLSYTRSYWQEFCPKILQTILHHDPTHGGLSEQSKFDSWYSKTLQSYGQFFGQIPPVDIWPESKDRFGRDLHFIRVNTQDNWVFPKPSFNISFKLQQRPVLTYTFLVIFSLVVTSCQAIFQLPNPINFTGSEFLVFYISIGIIGIILANWLHFNLRLPVDSTNQNPDLNTYEIALLAGGNDRMIITAIASLVKQGYVEAVKEKVTLSSFRIYLRETRNKLVLRKNIDDIVDTVEKTVAQNILEFDGEIEQIFRRSKGIEEDIRSRFQQLELFLSDAQEFKAQLYPSLILLLLLGLGLCKMIVGIFRDKPVGFLCMCMGVILVCGARFLIKPHRSRYGDRVFNNLAEKSQDLKTVNSSDSNLPISVALFGLTVLKSDSDLADLYQMLASTKIGGGGDGGGDGGGGCGGGGCGGCGGCGGGG